MEKGVGSRTPAPGVPRTIRPVPPQRRLVLGRAGDAAATTGGRNVPGSPLRNANVAQEQDADRGRRSFAGDRHWSQHVGFQHREYGSDEEITGAGSTRTRDL